MPMMLKPFSKIMVMISPEACLATASGLMMARVRCNVFIFYFGHRKKIGGRPLKRAAASSGSRSHDGEHCFADLSRRLHHANAGGLQSLHFFSGGAVPAGDDGAG